MNGRITWSVCLLKFKTLHNIKIHDQKQEDFWYWIPINDGQFKTKSVWNHIRNKHSEFNWANIIWDKKCAPKMSICALLVKLSRLNTNDRISRWNNIIDRSCVFCVNQNEDIDHLFFNRSYSRQIIEEIMLKLQINLGNSFEINQILEILCRIVTNYLNISRTLLLLLWFGTSFAKENLGFSKSLSF